MSALKPLLGISVVLLFCSGLAWAGGQSSIAVNGISLFWLCGATAFLLHWLAFIPAYTWQTEHYFDLIGSVSYISATVLALSVRAGNGDLIDWRTVILGSFVILWALRLGYFLFQRVRRSGKDQRFDAIKPHFWRFAFTWTLGGAWVFVTASAALVALTSLPESAAANIAQPTNFLSGLSGIVLSGIGIMLWLAGFAIEIIADKQKSLFRQQTENRHKFITTGLWQYSRHPNYFGEIILWTGIALIALPVMQGWQYVTLVSPVFVIFLLTRVSGIPMLEKSAEERWGNDPEYQRYVATTPVLLPSLGR